MSDVKIIITADSKKGQAAIKKLDDNVDRLGKTSQKAIPGIKGMWKQMAGGIAVAYGVIRSIKGLTKWMGDAIEKAGIQEDAEKSLEAALESTGRRVEVNMEHFKNYASELQRTTRFGDEQIIGAQSLLLQLTKLDRDGIDIATKGSLGLATVYKQDLYAATTLVAKALAGNYGALSRYGIVVSRTATDEEKRASILEQLGVMYGRAKADVETYRGGITQLSNTYGDLKEKVGAAVTENKDFRDTIILVQQVMRDFVDSGALEKWTDFLAEAAKAIIPKSFQQELTLIALQLGIDAAEARKFKEEMEAIDEQIDKWGKGFDEFFEKIDPTDKFDYAAQQARMFLLEIELELNRWKIPKLVRTPEELMQSMGFTDFGSEFENQWGIFEASYDEKMNTFQDSLMESIGLGMTGVTGLTEEATTQQLDALNMIGGALTSLGTHNKALAYAGAIINTANAITEALPNIPLSFIIGAMGAVEIAKIASTSIPSAATGADVLREGLVHVHPGEVIRQPSSLKETFREVIREPGGGNLPQNLHLHVKIGNDRFFDATIKNVNEGFRRGKIKVRNIQ